MRKTTVGIALFTLVGALLTACGQETLDSRQIDNNGGLAYKHGSTDPFTGVVAFKDTIPSNLQDYWTANIATVPGHPVNQVLSACEEHYVKGLPDGGAWCEGTGGHKAFVLHYKDEQFDGPSTLYNADTGELIKDQSWSAGKLEGTVKTYTYDGKQLISRVDWKDGLPDGTVQQWNTRGEATINAIYKAGQIDSGTFSTDDGTFKSTTEFRDGKPNGAFVKVLEQGDPLQKGVFADGQREGEWDDQSIGVTETYNQIHRSCWDAKIDLGHALTSPAHIDSHWKQGKLDGEAKAWDVDGKLLFDLHFSDGSLVGTNLVVNDSGTTQTFNLNAGHVVSEPVSASSSAVPSEAPQEPTKAQPGRASSISSPADALSGSVQILGTGNACLDDWEAAYRKERGDDAVIAYDQIDEWTEDCKQGKTAPKN
ncbi:antitoxin component YwqK of YwqJK toxin-antitoxin module [Rhodanobacter sp. K2T2]|uniref:toxin-antitoxin system YwqK family antitoxin n=1 Tax=Rhodanobacter sp. K2T2 TaxID=2723085 RepID=UPI0015CB0395|nr:hypothetical protein [Rhodanobacter sp. K2T2]NYE30038.1 antitoxin component YwqK of YwqJK toxin-antitoxin module [Rhodanobacter sp. K2T2]